jgi:hypothetical protein
MLSNPGMATPLLSCQPGPVGGKIAGDRDPRQISSTRTPRMQGRPRRPEMVLEHGIGDEAKWSDGCS